MENTELTNNAVEETVKDAAVKETVNITSDTTFAQKHPVLYLSGVAALFGGATMAGAYVVDGAVRGVKKLVGKARDKIANKRAEKAKKVEVVTVEKND